MIAARDLDGVLVEVLPELEADFAVYRRKRIEDLEFTQSFFNYSFLPTLQVSLDQNIEEFCSRAFALIEQLVRDGDGEVQSVLRAEFFAYGSVCEKWMRRARSHMGPHTRVRALEAGTENSE